MNAITKKRIVKLWHEPTGYWAELRRGLRCVAADTHTCHEDTLPDLERAVARATVCNCDDCTATVTR